MFKNLKDIQIVSYVDYFPSTGQSQWYVYSYPYTLKYYNDITNHSLGELFKYVCEVLLF